MTEASANPGEPSSILVVEDDGDTAAMIRKLLEEKFGAHVVVVSTRADAQRELAAGPFDIVTLDFMLADGDGLELLSKISAGGGPLAIMVTGHGDEETASKALRYGAAGYVIKDRSLSSTLPDAVEKALDRISLARINEALELERQQLLSVFDSIGEPIYVSDPDTYEILYANQAVRGNFGDVLGKKCHEALQGLSSPCPFCTNHLIFGDRAGIPHTWEFKNMRNNRRYRCIDKAIRWPDGRMVRSEIAVDITDIKLAEEKLRFQAYLLHTVEQAVIATDLEGRVIFWNRYAEQIYGWAAGEALGQIVFDMFPAWTLEKHGGEIAARMRSGESWSGEMLTGRRDGTEFHAMVRAAPIHDEHGNVSGMVGIVSDVSDRKRSEEALRNVLKETNERREEISALLESTRYVLEHSDFGDAARAVYELCKRLIGANAGFLALLDDEDGEVTVLLKEGVGPQEEMDVAGLLSAWGPREAFRSGRAAYDNDFAASAASGETAGGRAPLDNILCAPLVIEGEPAGVMGFGNKRGGFSRRDELMASAFSEIAALALRSSHAYEMLEDSEERFRSVAETANEAIICVDVDERVTFWNQGAERIFGYGAGEMLGDGLEVLMPERFREINRRVLSRLRGRGRTGNAGRTYEEVALRKDDSEFPAELSLSTWTHAGKQYFTVIIRDITERRKSEEALRDSEERYRRLVETAPDVIYTISTDGTITSLNPAFETMTGWSKDEWIGKSFAGLVHPDDLQRAVETFEQASGGGSPPPYELRILTKSGRYTHGEFISSPQEVEGEVVGELGIVRDISERKIAASTVSEADKKYHDIFMNSIEGLFQSTPEGRLLTANPAFASMLGYDSGDEIISSITDITSLYVDPARRHELMRLLEENSVLYGFEAELYRKDGGTVWASINAREVSGDGGAFTYFEGSVVDVTERKSAEEMLRHTYELYQGLMQASPDAITVTDLSGKVTGASERTAELHGFDSVDDVIGMNAFEFIAPEDRERAVRNLEMTLEDGVNRGIEYEMLKSDGSRFTGALDAALLRETDGNPGAFIATVRDVTDRRLAREELARANVELDSYAQVVSHDLRGPLSNIDIATTTLLRLLEAPGSASGSPDILEVARVLSDNVKKAQELVLNLLALGEAGQKPMRVSMVDVSDVVRDITSEAAAEIRRLGIEFMADDDLGRVQGDSTQIYQLFSNLMWNAIKHNDSPVPVIEVRYLGAVSGAHRYLVRDNGSGIPPENLDRIFMPFFSDKSGEPGIGLVTVQRIIAAYGGSIMAFNDNGACFEFEIADFPEPS